MNLSTLPPIGRNGIVNAVRKLTDMPTTGWRDIDPDSTFLAGQLATLAADSNGKVVVQTVDSTGDKVVGMFFTHNTTTFYRPSFREAHTFGENVSAPTVIYVNPYMRAGFYQVETESGGSYTVKTETTDYTVNVTNGAITNASGTIGATDTIYVTYQYKDLNLSGINQPLGSGKACLLEEVGEVATLIYDTTCTWTLGASIYYTAAGYLTTTNSGSAIIGRVTKAPSATDPELCAKLNFA